MKRIVSTALSVAALGAATVAGIEAASAESRWICIPPAVAQALSQDFSHLRNPQQEEHP